MSFTRNLQRESQICEMYFQFGIFYAADRPLSLIGYTYSDWDDDGTDYKSTSGYIFKFGLGPFFWSSKKKSMISLSTAEAEYRGAMNVATQVVWLQGLLSKFGIQYPLPTIIFCDNQGSIQISIDPVHKQRTKHIEIDCHFIRYHLVHGALKLFSVSSKDQLADIFTKSLPKERTRDLVNNLKLVSHPP